MALIEPVVVGLVTMVAPLVVRFLKAVWERTTSDKHWEIQIKPDGLSVTIVGMDTAKDVKNITEIIAKSSKSSPDIAQ